MDISSNFQTNLETDFTLQNRSARADEMDPLQPEEYVGRIPALEISIGTQRRVNSVGCSAPSVRLRVGQSSSVRADSMRKTVKKPAKFQTNDLKFKIVLQ